jgi:site-specific DNA recombinase
VSTYSRPHLAVTEPIPCVSYARVSQAREEMISPDIQFEANRQWAASRNRVIVAEIVDPNATGRNFDRKIQQAIAMVEDGTAQEILVYKFSRFGRHRRGWELNYGRLEDVGGDLVSSTEEVDASTATGKLTRGVLKEIAAFESDRFSDQWKDTAAYRESIGLPHTATPRFGYRHHKCSFQEYTKGGHKIVHEKDKECQPGPNGEACREEYRIDPVTGPALRSMYEMYLSGSSLASIAAWCIDEAIPTTEGGNWYASTVADVLDAGFGAGYLQVGVKKPKKGARVNRSARPHGYVMGSQDPVIDEKQWPEYRARRLVMKGNASETRTRWPLSGITRCGRCGGGMTCTTGGPAGKQNIKGYIMRCMGMQNSLSCQGVWRATHIVETALMDALDAVADELEAEGRRVARTVRDQRSDRSLLRKRLEGELRTTERGKANLIDAIVAGAVSTTDAAAKRQELDEDIARIERSLARLEAPVKAWTPPEVRSLREDWTRLPNSTKREMVRLLVESITVHPDKSIDVMLAPALRG